MGDRILFIEPHPDDLIQSCPELLVDSTDDLTVLTCCNTDDRDTGKYNLIRDVTTIVWPTPEIHWDHAARYRDDRASLSDEIATTQNSLFRASETFRFDKFTKIYIPLGLYHPHHIEVHEFFYYYMDMRIEDIVFYVDQPYYNIGISEDLKSKIDNVATVVETPHISRRSLMLKMFKSKYLTTEESKIKCSRYISPEDWS